MFFTATALFSLACILLLPPLCRGGEYDFDLTEIEKKPYHLGGYIEINPVLFGLNKDSRFYRLRFYDRDEGSTLDQQGFSLQLEGSYEKGKSRFFVRTNSSLLHTYEGWTGNTTLYEGLFSLKPSSSLTIDIGKKTMKWGKGYAWNPAAFVDRPKDPDDPDLSREGFFVVSMDYIKSFNSSLKTFSFTPVLIPVFGDMNKDFGEAGHLNFAAKLYFLLLDTDIDLMLLSGGSKGQRYGFDFSRNIVPNFEIHGELARIEDFEKTAIDGNGTISIREFDALSALLGLRYLSSMDTTYILEYYHNSAGYTEGEMRDFFTFVDRGYDTFLSSGTDNLLKRARGLTTPGYGGMNPMRNYLYLRISQKEPFDILYFIPAITWIFNLEDRSFSLSPELLYTGVTNLELRLKGTFLEGDEFSEYIEKQNNYKIELRIRYFF